MHMDTLKNRKSQVMLEYMNKRCTPLIPLQMCCNTDTRIWGTIVPYILKKTSKTDCSMHVLGTSKVVFLCAINSPVLFLAS